MVEISEGFKNPLKISEIFFLGKFQILQNRRFNTDCKVVTFSETGRNPVENHFPAMQVSVYI
jgi:hypothetical protein